MQVLFLVAACLYGLSSALELPHPIPQNLLTFLAHTKQPPVGSGFLQMAVINANSTPNGILRKRQIDDPLLNIGNGYIIQSTRNRFIFQI
jgi:hypothetical protein